MCSFSAGDAHDPIRNYTTDVDRLSTVAGAPANGGRTAPLADAGWSARPRGFGIARPTLILR